MDVRVITFKHGGLGTSVWKKKHNKGSIFFFLQNLVPN